MLTSFKHAEQGDRSAEQMQITVMRAELATQIERHTGEDGARPTAIPGLLLGRCSEIQHPVHTMYQPAFCLMAQGSKRVLLNDEQYLYDPSRYLVVSQNLPVCTQHMDATPEHPVLGMRIEFDTKDVATAALQMKPVERPPTHRCQRGMFTGELTPALFDV